MPYPDGPTSVDNLHAVSRRHHRAKTHTRWRVSLDPDTGETTWTSPTGRKRTTRPPQRWTLPGETPAIASPEYMRPPTSDRNGNDATAADHGNRERADEDLPDSGMPDDPPPF